MLSMSHDVHRYNKADNPLQQANSLKKMAIDVQKILDFIAGLLEKGFHTFIWIRPQATLTLTIALSLSKPSVHHTV